MDVVLIPGAWTGAWIWEGVAERLRVLGRTVHAPTLSGLDGDTSTPGDVSAIGLETHVDDVTRLLDGADLRGALLVGHSYSGFVAALAAERRLERVAHTAFVEAFLPRRGVSLLEAAGLDAASERRAIERHEGRWPPPTADELRGQPGLTKAQRRRLLAGFVGHPGRTVTEPAELEGPLERLRATWIARRPPSGEDARALPSSPTWSFRTIDAGHWPMLAAPEELAALLDEIVQNHA